MRRGLPLGLLLLALACGGGETESAAPAKTADRAAPAPARAAPPANRPPRIDLLAVDPAEPRAGDRVRAVVRASDPEGDPVELGYLWRVNGNTVPGAGDSISLETARKGDRIELRVTASDGRAESEASELVRKVANSAPRLQGIRIEPSEHVLAGAQLVAQPQVSDPDGDSLEFDFHWVVNGHAVDAAGPMLSTAGMRRGDRIAVFASASDGDDRSDTVESESVKLENAPPVVESMSQGTQEGGVFRYQVVARDPDGDRGLRYSLAEAPEGMQIDPLQGSIEWKPSVQQAGSHPVTVDVADGRGGVAHMRFEVQIGVTEPAPAAPAEGGATPAARTP